MDWGLIGMTMLGGGLALGLVSVMLDKRGLSALGMIICISGAIPLSIWFYQDVDQQKNRLHRNRWLSAHW